MQEASLTTSLLAALTATLSHLDMHCVLLATGLASCVVSVTLCALLYKRWGRRTRESAERAADAASVRNAASATRACKKRRRYKCTGKPKKYGTKGPKMHQGGNVKPQSGLYSTKPVQVARPADVTPSQRRGSASKRERQPPPVATHEVATVFYQECKGKAAEQEPLRDDQDHSGLQKSLGEAVKMQQKAEHGDADFVVPLDKGTNVMEPSKKIVIKDSAANAEPRKFDFLKVQHVKKMTTKPLENSGQEDDSMTGCFNVNSKECKGNTLQSSNCSAEKPVVEATLGNQGSTNVETRTVSSVVSNSSNVEGSNKLKQMPEKCQPELERQMKRELQHKNCRKDVEEHRLHLPEEREHWSQGLQPEEHCKDQDMLQPEQKKQDLQSEEHRTAVGAPDPECQEQSQEPEEHSKDKDLLQPEQKKQDLQPEEHCKDRELQHEEKHLQPEAQRQEQHLLPEEHSRDQHPVKLPPEEHSKAKDSLKSLPEEHCESPDLLQSEWKKQDLQPEEQRKDQKLLQPECKESQEPEAHRKDQDCLKPLPEEHSKDQDLLHPKQKKQDLQSKERREDQELLQPECKEQSQEPEEHHKDQDLQTEHKRQDLESEEHCKDLELQHKEKLLQPEEHGQDQNLLQAECRNQVLQLLKCSKEQDLLQFQSKEQDLVPEEHSKEHDQLQPEQEQQDQQPEEYSKGCDLEPQRHSKEQNLLKPLPREHSKGRVVLQPEYREQDLEPQEPSKDDDLLKPLSEAQMQDLLQFVLPSEKGQDMDFWTKDASKILDHLPKEQNHQPLHLKLQEELLQTIEQSCELERQSEDKVNEQLLKLAEGRPGLDLEIPDACIKLLPVDLRASKTHSTEESTTCPSREPSEVPQTVDVIFSVHYIPRSSSQCLAVTGSHEELGSWQTFIPLQRSGEGCWSATVALPVDFHCEWKFVLVEKGEIQQWEECGNRHLHTGTGGVVRLQKSWGQI